MKTQFALGIALCGMMLSSMTLHAQSAYSHDSSPTFLRPNWMSQVPGTMTLSKMSLPGTHESLSMVGGDLVQCQSMSLQDQLNAGIRVIDIRLGPDFSKAGGLRVYHGNLDQNHTFDDVMQTLVAFLAINPTEAVLMRVKNETTDDYALNTTDFETFFDNYWGAYALNFWNPMATANQGYGINPTLDAIRGKVVVLQNFTSTLKNSSGGTNTYGLNYSQFSAQDDYQVDAIWDLYTKWEEVEGQLMIANTMEDFGNPKNMVFINYLSGATNPGYNPVMPYFVASGKSSPQTSAPQLWTGLIVSPSSSDYPDFPRSCDTGVVKALQVCSISYDGTNDLTASWIAKSDLKGTGIIMADFPGPQLIWLVLSQNSPYILY
jgi:1-phosphatidylinositol phosphodiesterase